MNTKKFRGGIILSLLLYSTIIYSQSSNKNFIRIKYNCIDNRLEDVKLYKDSLLMTWVDLSALDTTPYVYKYFYDNKRIERGYSLYENNKLLKVDTLQKDKNGEIYQRIIIGEYDHCKGIVECTHDKYGRLVEIKKYSYPKGMNKPKKRVLEYWHKYYYVSNVDYDLLFNNLNNNQ